MIDYLQFHQAFLVSLQNAKEAYIKANDLDIQNGGEYFSFDNLYMTANAYVVTNSLDTSDLLGLSMTDFVYALLESANKKELPSREIMLGNENAKISKDFAKKLF